MTPAKFVEHYYCPPFDATLLPSFIKIHSRLWELRRQAKMCKNSKCQGPWLCLNLSNMNYLPTCTSKLMVQHPCKVSFKAMQRCRRSWEDKLKCVKILSVKDHNSAKICRIGMISIHALLDLWCNIPTKLYSNSCKGVGGRQKIS